MSIHWHYQIMRHLTDKGETYYTMHEYYPMADGDGWTQDPVSIDGESLGDIVWMLKAMLNDIEKHGVKDYDAEP